MKPDIFISLRYKEAKVEGYALREALLQLQPEVNVYINDTEVGNDLLVEIAQMLHAATLVVVMGTETYGEATNSSFSTHEELKSIAAKKKPVFLIKMCSELNTLASFIFSTTKFEIWPPGTRIPSGLAEHVLARLDSLKKGNSTS